MTTKGPLRLGLGADDNGASLMASILPLLQQHSRIESVRQYPAQTDTNGRPYSVTAIEVAKAVASDELDRAILICGTGIGMCVAATKVPGVRAAVVHDGYSAERSVLSNNCQIMTLGSKIVAPTLASRLVNDWLSYDFDPRSPSSAKLQVIDDFERTSSSERST